LAQNEVRADIFSDSLAVFQSERVASPPEADRCGGRKGGLGGIPPALQILGEISSNFFERTPPVRKPLAYQTEPTPRRFTLPSMYFLLKNTEITGWNILVSIELLVITGQNALIDGYLAN